jgi:hypothetical protein
LKGEARPNAFTQLATQVEDPWYEKLLGPLRIAMTNYASRSWVNSRFSKGAQSISEQQEEPYLSNEFLKGAQLAALEFYRGSISLENITTPELHSSLNDGLRVLGDTHGLKLRLTNFIISNMKVKEIWICFGDANRAKSTLNLAPIHTVVSDNPGIYWRYNRKTKNWYYTEMNFEYCIDPSVKDISQDLPDPTLAERTKATTTGAVLGIEVEYDLKFEAVLNDRKNGELQKTFYIDRLASMRFETLHFTGKCNSKWKIADVDNYFASQVLKETLS